MNLASSERETIITFDETPAHAVVFTYSKQWQKHIEGKLAIKGTPNGFGGKEYAIPKGRIRMPMVPRKLSPQQREKIGQRLRAARRKKPPTPPGKHVTTKKPKTGRPAMALP